MSPHLLDIAQRQGGVFTREQALHCGYGGPRIRSKLAPYAPWVVVRRGAYAERTLWESSTEDERNLMRDWATHLTYSKPHLLSHDSAARVWGIPLLRPRRVLTHLTREGVFGTRTEHGVKHHLTQDFAIAQSQQTGAPVTSVARTVLDLGREHGLAQGVVAADYALRAGTSTRDFARELVHMRRWPHIVRARTAVSLADAGAESPGESLARLFLLDLNLGAVVTQFPVYAGGRCYWVDLRVGRHLVEFDGRVKYAGPLGPAERSTEEVLWEEKQRQTAICGLGFGMSRLSWGDLFGDARGSARNRIMREYAVTVARFGKEISDTEQAYADSHRRRTFAA